MTVAATKTCANPRCRRTRLIGDSGYCVSHYWRWQAANRVPPVLRSDGLVHFVALPHRPKYTRRQADALEELAQTPNLTLATYQAEKARILQGLA